MFLRNITEPIKAVSGIKAASVQNLSKLGINTVSDIIVHYPRDWENRKVLVPLKDFQNNIVCTIVTVIDRTFMGYGNTKAMKLFIEDESARAVLLCFNLKRRSYMEKQFEVGTKHMIWGKFKYIKGEIQSSSFNYGSPLSNKNFGKILPVYPLTAGLNQNDFRKFTDIFLKKYINSVEDELPAGIIEKYDLLQKKDAINEIHYPSSMDLLEKAKKTIIYEELFYLEVMIARRTIERKKNVKNILNVNDKINISLTPLQQHLLKRLPFQLTKGQMDAVLEINQDMSSNIPMARLLQGDVGSGKTLVSFMAALKAVEEKGQAAIMAPTELLARQHAENAAKLLEPMGIRIAFLTGNVKSAGRKELLKNLKNAMVDIVIGTHALFSKDVEYKNLKLVIIDEQHRFGVTQRSLIMSKGDSPALLMMSATPIPRSLALTIFGDMDVSIIKDNPPGRKQIITHLAKESNEKKVYDFVRKEIIKGRQAYFVYPLIADGEEIKDAQSMAQRLSKKIFPDSKVALIHSKIPDEEKKQTMDNFRKGDINILAATSVVEVGVDVPNATCMVIEHAERFGLSALHQLRGRVGRGQEQSYCFLVYSDEYTEDAKNRLLVMLENSDGFIIAEEDLKIRGPGQITGIEQSGYLSLGLANPVRDFEELKKARDDVFSILENDPDLLLENNRIIARVLQEAPPFNEVTL
ncbi:MAG: ATP-dependent DNA helicase RecG [Treponema sp.]|nr:ATP-dependent DNA helicase RecG [Treponema sp.]